MLGPALPRTIFLVTLLSVFLSGCKLVVMVTSGGDIQSLSGLRDCGGGNLCEFEVADADFSDTFLAIPKPGYEFVKWADGGPSFRCANSTNADCTVALSGDPLSILIVSLFETAHVMPIFKDVGFDSDGDGVLDRQDDDDDNDGVLDVDDECPLNDDLSCHIDTIVVDGTIWAQVDQFTDLTWYEFNRVCRDGPCIGNGVLNGFNMTGWNWASVDEVNALFNYYIGSNELGPGPDDHYVQNESWAADFFALGWRETHFNGLDPLHPIVYGFVNEKVVVSDHEEGRLGTMSSTPTTSRANTANLRWLSIANDQVGAWLYKTP